MTDQSQAAIDDVVEVRRVDRTGSEATETWVLATIIDMDDHKVTVMFKDGTTQEFAADEADEWRLA